MPWSLNDQRFLRSLRIVADEPPTPSPRFYVEPGKVAGEYNVVDKTGRFSEHVFTPKNFKDTKASAEDFAKQLNEKHVEKHGEQA